MLNVKFTRKARTKLKEERAASLRVKLEEEVHEWTLCCGAGDSEVIMPKLLALIGKGSIDDVKLVVEGIEVYLDREIMNKIKEEGSCRDLIIDVEEGKFVVKGLRLVSYCQLKPPY